MTLDEYFRLIGDNWDNLEKLINKFHPNSYPLSGRDHLRIYPITAKKAEAVCEKIREEINTQNPVQTAIKARDDKNIGILIRIFNETWFGMPESSAIHNEPGFYVLCDLCVLPDGLEFDENDNLIKE